MRPCHGQSEIAEVQSFARLAVRMVAAAGNGDIVIAADNQIPFAFEFAAIVLFLHARIQPRQGPGAFIRDESI